MTKATSRSDKTALRDEVVSRRVRQFGSARDGLRELRLQRLTAIAVIPLSLYFAASEKRQPTGFRCLYQSWSQSSSFLRGHACADRHSLGRSGLCAPAHRRAV